MSTTAYTREDWAELQRIEEFLADEPPGIDNRVWDTLVQAHEAACVEAEAEACVKGAATAGLALFTDADGHVWHLGEPWAILPTYYEIHSDDGRSSIRNAGLIHSAISGMTRP